MSPLIPIRAVTRRQPRALSLSLSLSIAAALLAIPVDARANGAFPAPFRIFAPADRSQDFTVTTNFGLIATRDGGVTWTWVCEHGLGDLGFLYQQAASPGHRIWAAAPAVGLVYTDDDACTWGAANGLGAGVQVWDYFADPGNGQRILAIIRRADSGGQQVFSLFVSTDGGTSFPAAPLYQAPAGDRLDSVEVSPAAPDRIYLTASRLVPDGTGPWLLRSDNSGQSFTMTDVAASAGPGTLRIAAVDPENADRVYFRSTGATDRLLVSADAGASFREALIAEGAMQFSAFLRRRDAARTLLVASMDGLTGEIFRSTDGAMSFEMMPDNLHVGSFVERGGVLYVLGDGITDPFLVGTSRDNAASFQPYVGYADVAGTRACGTDLRPACASTCDNLQNAGLFRPEICQTLVGPDGGDAGADASADGRDAGHVVVGRPYGSSSGCGCAVERGEVSGTGGAGGLATLQVALMMLMLRRSRRR